MTADSSWLVELDELLNKLCTDVLSPSEQQELNDLLRIGVEQRLYYRRYMHLHAAIKWNTSKRHDEATSLKQALADGCDRSPEAASSPLFPTRLTAVSSVQKVCPTGLPTSSPVLSFLWHHPPRHGRLFLLGLAGGVSGGNGDFRDRAVDRLLHACVPARTGRQAIVAAQPVGR